MKLNEVIACMRGDAFATKPVTADPTETLSAVAVKMRDSNVGTVVIVENNKPVGMVTDRDLALALGAERGATEERVEHVMAAPVRTIPEGAGIFAATQCMRDAGVRRLPIVDAKGNLAGIVALDDLMRLLGRELYNLAEGIKAEMQVNSAARATASGRLGGK